MNYVIELQNGELSYMPFTEEQVRAGEALAEFYTRCATAATDTEVDHVILILDRDGNVFNRQFFNHQNGQFMPYHQG